MKDIKVSKKLWRRLKELRDQQGFVHFNSTVEFLLDYFEKDTLSEEKPVIPEPKKKVDREELIKQISDILDKKGY